MLVEYKPFEPAFYHTDIADWGMALAFARHAGPRAKVLVDTGHHLQGTNIEHIVAFKENLRVLLLGMLFVVLAARLELHDLIAVGLPSLGLVAFLVLKGWIGAAADDFSMKTAKVFL